MGDVWPSNTGANIGEWATVGKFKEEVENNGYEVDVSGISDINNALLKYNNELNIYKEGSSANISTFEITASPDGTLLTGTKKETTKVAATTWTQTGTSVTNGTVTLTVGQAVTGYSVTVGSTTYGDTKWNVLGVKDGKLLITTNADVANQELSGRSGYLNGISTLNSAVSGYKNTNLGDSVRIIDVDDINRVTGYNPATANYESGKINAYGNEVTYYWKGDSYPYYSGSNNVKNSLTEEHNKFYYPDSSVSGGWTYSAKSTLATTSNKVGITTLTGNYYFYYPKTLTTSSSGTTNGIATNSPAYKLLFKEDVTYWLGSQYVNCYVNYANFGLRMVREGCVCNGYLADSDGQEMLSRWGVRPVVSLKSEVNVTSAGAISLD